MRADRLLSLLMLLQTRGCLTAETLADELEVSIRTIYRDLQALSMAGVPVYAERGPGGGCRLLESYRTQLTGLTPGEARALFMLSIPAALDQLGVTQELKGALLKLSAALPAVRKPEEERTRARIYLDPGEWTPQEKMLPTLQTLHAALWQDHLLRLQVLLPFDTLSEQVVAPLGLAAKANIWYLVARRSDHLRVLRVSAVQQAEILPESFTRPSDFDLPAFWKDWCERVEADRQPYWVTVRANSRLLPELRRTTGGHLVAMPLDDGWLQCRLPFESLVEARMRLLSWGSAVEVLEPLALRRSMQDFARQITAVYREP